ncbi:uncharacterized protein LOC117177053 isoform X2 [Belonocnema kinseyi]|uniref:uncharacterized protein LOC117177053 isoform X2 n=1 Tax=Belonocnema kinseyi TaxID=2817044 RepID=UPI00143CFCB6|nr:uncharacterized protein LOC117177053 isoform X2 [Belonocnema kinseyi]
MNYVEENFTLKLDADDENNNKIDTDRRKTTITRQRKLAPESSEEGLSQIIQQDDLIFKLKNGNKNLRQTFQDYKETMDACLHGKNELLSKYVRYVEEILEKLTIVNTRLAENKARNKSLNAKYLNEIGTLKLKNIILKGELAKEKAENMGIYPPYQGRYQSSDNGIAQQFISSTASEENCLNSDTTTTSDLESAKLFESDSESRKKINRQRLRKKGTTKRISTEIYSSYKCGICKKRINSRAILYSHMIQVHRKNNYSNVRRIDGLVKKCIPRSRM